MENRIPEIIHYCWFGRNPIPESFQACIESWRRFFPGYEIREWNEDNFDVACCDYVREAYEAGRYAFVSDYARYKILYEYGGLYFDTDVEVIRSFDDILARGPFIGMEDAASVAPGLGIGAAPGLPFFKRLTDAYDTMHFLLPDGTFNLQTVVEYTTNELRKSGLTEGEEIQCVEGLYIYPREYFCPVDYYTGKIRLTENTHSIHHYAATWHSPREKYAFDTQKVLCRILPRGFAAKAAEALSILKFDGFGALIRKLKNR